MSSSEVLSQSEVENLLNAMETSGKSVSNSGGGGVRLREKVTAYDFKRPERVGKEQMRALQTMHEAFARNFGVALSALLRSIVEVKLTSVDQLTYSEFVFSLENPTCFNLLKAEPLEGNMILDINPAILYPILDRLLGGGKDGGHVSRRPLTEIEIRLSSKMTNLFLLELTRAWESVIKLDFMVTQVESNPQLVQIVPPNEVVVLISFEITYNDLRGMINLCIPFNSIERISDRLSANSWSSYTKRESTPEMVSQISQNMKGSVVEVVARVADTTISANELINLRVNDIITTNKDIHTPIVITVEGAPKFAANAGIFKGHKAICIEASAADPNAVQK